MILTRLDEILKEKNISINKLSNDTGISRKALTSLANNDSKGIQFQTLEKLINYLDISIEQFFRDDRESVLLSFMPINEVLNPIYAIESIVNESEFNEIMYVQSLWNFESDLKESIRYFSSPMFVTGLVQNENNKQVLYGISIDMDEENIRKEDEENFLFILNNISKDQLYYFVLHLIVNFLEKNKAVKKLLGKTTMEQFPVFFSYLQFKDLLIFDLIDYGDKDINIDYDFSGDDKEKEKINISISNVDLSKYLK